MSESVGTARLDIVVDTSQFDTAINAAKRSVSGMSAAAQAEYNKLNAAEKRRVDSLIKQADTLGFTRQQQILYNAALKGTPTHILDELKTKLGGVSSAAQNATRQQQRLNSEVTRGAISAKQHAAALRGVPAQLTDIFTGLASGQNPFTVILQQGGQLKDMFGGVVPAARALGGAIAGLINPLTIAAGVIGTLGFAWLQATERGEAFNKALILTGNYAGATASDLEGMAARLDDVTNATQGRASEVLAQVAATGRFTADQLSMVSEAALRMEDATGQAIEETVKQFASLADDPVSALLKLNDTQHFLTQETLNQVKSLAEQGRQADATQVAIEALYNAINTRAPQAVESMGLLETALHGVKNGAKEMWDELVNGFARVDREAKQGLEGLSRYFNILRSGGGMGAIFSFNAVTGATGEAPRPPKRAPGTGGGGAVDSEQARAAIEFEKEALRFATQRQRMEQEIKDARALGLKAKKSEEEIEKRIAAIRDSYKRKERKGKSGEGAARALERSESRAALQGLQDDLKKEQGALQNGTQLLEAQYGARLVTIEEYYDKQRELAQQGLAAEEKALTGQIELLRARSLTGKDTVDNTREIAEKEAELAKVRADSATKLQVLTIKEEDALKQRKLAAQAYKEALDETTTSLQMEMDSRIARVGMGEREFEIESRITEIYRQQAKELLNLARARDAGDLDAETYEIRKKQLEESTETEVGIVRDGYDRMAQAQGNWVNGAKKAYDDFLDRTKDVAGQTYDLFSNAFGGLSDVISDALVDGTADWDDFFKNILRQATKMLTDQALAKAFSFLSSTPSSGAGQSGGGGFDWGGALGSIANAWSGDWFGFWKNGGAFAGGSPQYFARGDVFDRPTSFGMSGGRMGIMGEAGPEAIMPLSRGRDGKLGVRALAQKAVNKVVEEHTHFHIEGLVDRRTIEQIERAVQKRGRTGVGRTG